MGSTAPSNNKPSSVYSRTGLLTSTGLHLNGSYVLHGLDMTWGNAIVPGKTRSLYGKHVLDHLAADGAGLAGGQVTVVAVLEVHAHLP